MSAPEPKPENPPAFPHTRVYSHACNDLFNQELPMSGLSMRDFFAAKADVARYGPQEAFEIANGGKRPTIKELAEYIAAIRYVEADAMLKERAKK